MERFDIDKAMTYIWAVIDSTLYNCYPLKKAKLFVKVKCECKFNHISKQTMQKIMKLVEYKFNVNKSLFNLSNSLFEDRFDITLMNSNNMCAGAQNEEDCSEDNKELEKRDCAIPNENEESDFEEFDFIEEKSSDVDTNC